MLGLKLNYAIDTLSTSLKCAIPSLNLNRYDQSKTLASITIYSILKQMWRINNCLTWIWFPLYHSYYFNNCISKSLNWCEYWIIYNIIIHISPDLTLALKTILAYSQTSYVASYSKTANYRIKIYKAMIFKGARIGHDVALGAAML